VIGVAVDTRIVVVLGREPGDAKAADWVANAAHREIPLLVLAVGYPLTGDQQALVEAAVGRAFDLRVQLEAELVPGRTELLAHLHPGDVVVVAATGREARRIGAALAGRGTA